LQINENRFLFVHLGSAAKRRNRDERRKRRVEFRESLVAIRYPSTRASREGLASLVATHEISSLATLGFNRWLSNSSCGTTCETRTPRVHAPGRTQLDAHPTGLIQPRYRARRKQSGGQRSDSVAQQRCHGIEQAAEQRRLLGRHARGITAVTARGDGRILTRRRRLRGGAKIDLQSIIGAPSSRDGPSRRNARKDSCVSWQFA